ncbi:ArsR/SmtB family transcription factor [Haloferax sp. DFSO52]|uniref:ArsR/SmtB family transcription factor n=1 Tax=Haloferax sp. DFSO52 TaxID=3388505 RepID=UPI003A8B60DE
MNGHRDGNPEAAFGALGSELRLDILRILESAARESASRLTFSDLYDRLDIESTSQLSYHLGRLDGVFVQKSSDKYGLTQAGERVVRAVYAGTYTAHPSFETVSIDGTCPRCEHTELLATFEEPFLSVVCDECGETVATYDLPPAQAVGRTPKEVLRSCDRRVYHELGMAIDGTCPTCGGIMDASSRQRTSPRTDEYVITASCRRCFNQVMHPSNSVCSTTRPSSQHTGLTGVTRRTSVRGTSTRIRPIGRSRSCPWTHSKRASRQTCSTRSSS